MVNPNGTGSDAAVDSDAFRRAGAQLVLVKPVKMAKLQEALMYLVSLEGPNVSGTTDIAATGAAL